MHAAKAASSTSMSHVGRAVGGKAAAAAFLGAAPTDRAMMWQNAVRSPVPFGQSVAELRSAVRSTAPAASQSVVSPASSAPDAAVTVLVVAEGGKAAQVKEKVAKAMQSRVLVALVVFVFTMVLLFAINPPMAQQEGDNKDATTRSWKKIAVWSTIAGLLALILPYASCLVKKDA
jgi:hypothetical protein